MPFFSWFNNEKVTSTQKVDILKELLHDDTASEVSTEKTVLVLNQAIPVSSSKAGGSNINSIPVFKDSFTKQETIDTNQKQQNKRRGFISFSGKSSRRKSEQATDRSRALSQETEYSFNVTTKKQRFRKLNAWRQVFIKNRNLSEDGDSLDGWIGKKFLRVAKSRMQRKVNIMLLERTSMALTLVEEQIKKMSKDDKLELFVNCLNGYICCLRFGYATKTHGLTTSRRKSTASQTSTEDNTTWYNTLKNIMGNLKMNQQEIAKRQQVLNKIYSRKTKDSVKLQQLQTQAVSGIYESFILFLLDFKSSQNIELTSKNLSEYITSSLLKKLISTININKEKVLKGLKTLAELNQSAFSSVMYLSFLNTKIENFLDSNIDSIIEMLNSFAKSTLEVAKQQHLIPFLDVLESNQIFKKNWKVNCQTRQLVLDNHDKEMMKILQKSLDKMYIQVEFSVQCLTLILLNNVQKLIS